MHDVEPHRHPLGLESPWTVRAVELNVQKQRVDVWAGHPAGIRWPCPERGAELAARPWPRQIPDSTGRLTESPHAKVARRCPLLAPVPNRRAPRREPSAVVAPKMP